MYFIVKNLINSNLNSIGFLSFYPNKTLKQLLNYYSLKFMYKFQFNLMLIRFIYLFKLYLFKNFSLLIHLIQTSGS